MSLEYKSSLSLTGLVIPLFSLFLSVILELSLQITALLQMSLSLSIGFALPSIAIAIPIVATLAAQFTLALGLSLPSFTLSLAIALNIELILVLGFLAALQAIINAIINASLIAYGWFGSAASLGASLTSELQNGWPDQTSADTDIIAYLFVATSGGGYTKDQIAAIGMMPQPPPPSPPTVDPPPPGTYPPPQVYTVGLAGLTISAPTGTGGVAATGHVDVTEAVTTPGIGAVTGIHLDTHGSGYTTMPSVQVTDSAAIVSATVASPIVITLPNALTVPIGNGFGVAIASVVGGTVISTATATSPIVITVPSTSGLATCSIAPGDYGLEGLSGLWYVHALTSTQAELWTDPVHSVPSDGSGVYVVDSASLTGNINGAACAKVITTKKIELYQDKDFLVPIAGYGSGYTGGTVSGSGAGAAALVTMGGGAVNALQSLLDGLHWPTSTALEGGVITFKAMLATVFQLMLDLEGNLQARASALASIKVGAAFIPPSISASIEFLAKISINLSANLKVSLPNLSASLSASLSAQISAIGSLVARIGFLLGLATSSVTLEIWEYRGPGSGLGNAIATGPGAVGWYDRTSSSSSVTAAVFGLTNPASIAAFNALFVGAVS